MIYKLYEKLSNEIRNKEKQDLTKGYAVYEISYYESINAISSVDTVLHCNLIDDIDEFVNTAYRKSRFDYKIKKTSETSYKIEEGFNNWTVKKLKDKGE
jgi:hypothetical protein